MFLSLQTTNFRKLTNASFDFAAGLTAIRALNEQGKSTLLEALAYAMFGSEALREPLADVVTWGEKDSSLKVVLRKRVNTSVIEIRRGKSGAEIDVDGKLAATGQKEVTRFVEGLLGAPPKVAAKLMLANQASLRGALSDGPTATAQLIEQLSNFALIDEVIQLVQEKLPSGSAVGHEQQVQTFAAQLESEKPGVLDLSAPTASLAAVLQASKVDQAELDAASLELPAAKAAAEVARGWARGLEAAQKTLADAKAATVVAEAALAKVNPVSSVSEGDLAKLRQWVAAAADIGAAQAAHKELSGLKVDQEWDDTRGSFDLAVAENAALIEKLAREQTDLDVKKAQVTGRLIKEQACAFCGKDLKDVPEVALLNSKLGKDLAAIQLDLGVAMTKLAEAREEQCALAGVASVDRTFAKVYAKHAKYIKLREETVPPGWTWTGPDLSKAVLAGAAEELAKAEAEVRRAAQDQGRKVTLQAEVERLAATAQTSQTWIDDLAPKVAADRSAGLEKDLQTKLSYHQTRLASQKVQAAALSAEMSTAKQVHEVKVQGYARIQAAYAAAQTSLEELHLNNVLIKKLRAARPKVADKLWGVILSTVSHYFSQIRGTQSVVTKDDTGFRVDGKPVTGLSGSTLDALGLAIRIALTKTFLPNNDFMILDEPGAACDDEREANMLGTISTAGFAQVLLVTHSGLADTFADQVITL